MGWAWNSQGVQWIWGIYCAICAHGLIKKFQVFTDAVHRVGWIQWINAWLIPNIYITFELVTTSVNSIVISKCLDLTSLLLTRLALWDGDKRASHSVSWFTATRVAGGYYRYKTAATGANKNKKPQNHKNRRCERVSSRFSRCCEFLLANDLLCDIWFNFSTEIKTLVGLFLRVNNT